MEVVQRNSELAHGIVERGEYEAVLAVAGGRHIKRLSPSFQHLRSIELDVGIVGDGLKIVPLITEAIKAEQAAKNEQ